MISFLIITLLLLVTAVPFGIMIRGLVVLNELIQLINGD